MAKDDVLTDEKQPSIVIPDCPELTGALAPLPREVKRQWKKTFTEALKDSIDQHPNDVSTQLLDAYREANKIFRVKEPKDHKDARQIPEWQVMRRQEQPFDELPSHVQKDIRKEDGRTSGTYLEVFAIDGKQYFFELPGAAAAKGKQPADDNKGAAADTGAGVSS